ncbi:MAG: hypothetical protein R3A48_17805 [Polyangiales bacterium]
MRHRARPRVGDAQGQGDVLAGVVEKLPDERRHRPSLHDQHPRRASGHRVLWSSWSAELQRLRTSTRPASHDCAWGGVGELLAKTRPRVCFFGHHHTRVDAEVAGVPCVGLNKGPYPGCLVAFEMKPGERPWRVLGEWPPRPPTPP